MSMDVEGCMIIGLYGTQILKQIPEFDLYSLIDRDHEHWLKCSAHYDARIEHCVYGVFIDDVYLYESDNFMLNEKWQKEVQEKAKEFKEITGLDPQLIGTQNVF